MEELFSNRAVSKLLKSVATAYLLKKENQFKIIAYEKAADVIGHLSREVKDIWVEGKLDEIPGVGKAIASHLHEYFRHGRSSHFDAVLKNIPETVFILMEIPTIGPKKADKLVRLLKLFNKKTVVDDLEAACRHNKVAQIENFGEKSQAEILESIKIYRQRAIKEERMILPYAFSIASEVINYLQKNPQIKRIDGLGSLRRMAATIGDIDIAVQLATKGRPSEIIDYFIRFPKRVKVNNAGEKKASIIVSPNVRVDLRVQQKVNYGSMLQYFTGSKTHNIKLREYALKKNLSLSEYGIKDLKAKKLHQFSDEERFYNFLGLQYIPPEIREGTDEIELAQNHQIPPLVKLKDIKGDLHLHSSFDLQPSHDLGSNNVGEILKKGRELGYQYVGFADHNPKSSLSEDDILAILKKRKQYIDKIFMSKKQEQSNYFIGLEVDILPDGKIALPTKGLDYLDYLIVSIHSVFNMEIKKMTSRVLAALEFPKVKILAHPTGRYFGKREGFELQWEKIFKVCREKNIALEINAWPERLDLPDTLVREAINYGLKLIINTDAHDIEQMTNMFYGVAVARRGWAKKSDIINTLPYNEFRKWLLG